MDLLGDVLYNLYGSTEVAYAAIATPADLRAAPGTVGRPPPGTRVRLLDDDDREVPTGRTGRIFVRNYGQLEQYSDGAAKPVVDGMMATGDVGHFDAAGRLFVDGRSDDMIVSGGENVYPAEVEELLAARPDVREAAVTGVADPRYGARLRAYVVRNPGSAVDEEQLCSYVRENLARYKVPREIVFVDELPRNPAGKVIKRDLG
jgi:fatty-acyl-CoA synthase